MSPHPLPVTEMDFLSMFAAMLTDCPANSSSFLVSDLLTASVCASGCILAIKLANIALTDHIKDGQRDGVIVVFANRLQFSQ